jgi:hypothetical protein
MSKFDKWADRPDASIDTIADLLKKTSNEHGGGPVENFYRSSTTRRLAWERSSEETCSRTGREQGGALRWIDPRKDALGFAAASGDAAAALATCRLIASKIQEKPVEACPWNVQAAAVEDIDATAELPSLEEMEAWLRENTPEQVDSAWVEAGLSTETWLSDPTNAQKRVRTRIWAMWTPREKAGTTAKPLFLAARGWRELRRLDPAQAWLDRAPGQDRERAWPDDAKLVFSPETSAMLARSLATVTHHPGTEPGAPVGPGWVLTARPEDDPASIYGSRVDDAGFLSTNRTLADGRHVIGDWGGPGSHRRASFRDSPEPVPVSLRMDPPRLDPPKRSAWVTRIDLHPAGDNWIAELHGRQFPDGAAFQPHWVRMSPRRLVETCLGGIGPARRSHLGMTTPALVFDAWSFRAE